MKKINIITVILVSSLFGLVSCVDLDITPKSVLTGEDIYTENGIKAYVAGLYNHLPMEDFHYDTDNEGLQAGYFVNLNVYSYWNSTGEMVNRNNVGRKRHRPGYWSEGFKIIRQANTLINDLPNYPALADNSRAWIAEAKFIRAYVYFQLAKRYGGLPKIFEPQVLDSNDESSLWVARVSHADTYDFILADLDEAIADMSLTSETGRANKYVAAAFKSRVALHAATTARYGSMKFPDWEVDGVLLEGIPSEKANGYFKQAWDAAKLVEGHYQLHKDNSDKTANYAEVWEKAEGNKESIWIRKYDYTMWAHSFDAMMAPPRMTTTYGDRYNPTLDWVELFDGLPINPATGHFSAFDDNGDYIVYDNCHQLWDGAEPRLRANLLLPGEMVKGGYKVDLRAGIFSQDIDPAVRKFKKFSRDDGADGGNYRSVTLEGQTNLFATNVILNSTADPRTQTDLYEVNGVRIYKNGLDGPKMSNNGGNNTLTGFFGRKHMNIAMTQPQTALFESTQSWIEIRYAEVLLNRAEAAIELAQSGESTYVGTNLLQDAFTIINDLRDRAGATLLTDPTELSTAPGHTNWTKPGTHGIGSFVEAPTRGLQIVRVERYKELAFESKIYWDLIRWFTYDTQINQYRKRGLYSFMFSKGATVDAAGIPDGKYIYDAKNTESGSDRITYPVNDYYEGIPSNELKNNPLLQKNRNQ
ncbi:MAG: RagB/SusD family nutrient uptake outer membrane protein [Candidatus Ordinivivax streblomastigis]|uniref:RagB/SusD family nutrient uptake outer membrane protein n=1 Tax=Candidatus Ordinivivax streblomastigis TaxID=2540710 RepID=A0A5M8NUT2_9BACT|nr:MAG: RagB/SusD family nutrient uptake outer membrane protein [Candidatus Ordinivivax streblomastigis]